MKGFNGFTQKGRLIRIPDRFFSELLPLIDTLPELKVTLHCFWRLQHKEGEIVYLRERELLADEAFLAGLAPRHDDRELVLRDGLERAVARGTLLQVTAHFEGGSENLYFVNTPRGRAAVRGSEEGKWQPNAGPFKPIDLHVERPNIFTLYEQNIGPLTPLIADRLHDLEAAYPEDWLVDAFEIAVTRNVRKLPYIEAILQRWQDEGRAADEENVRDSRRFISGTYRDDIEY